MLGMMPLFVYTHTGDSTSKKQQFITKNSLQELGLMPIMTTDQARNQQQAEYLGDRQCFWMCACHAIDLAVWEGKAAIADRAGFIGQTKQFATYMR